RRESGNRAKRGTPRRSANSGTVVFVASAHPDGSVEATHSSHHCLVAPAWGGVEPLVHAPEGVQPADVCRVGVVDDPVLERERAHARRLPQSRRHVRAIDGKSLFVAELAAGIHRAEVVLDGSRLLLLLGKRHLEVVVEVAPERRCPREAPLHPLLVRLKLLERRARDRGECGVVVLEVDDKTVESVRNRRAGRTPRRVLGTEHEVVDEELGAPSEEVLQRGAALVGLESVLLLDPDPRQLLASPRQLVAAPRQLLLGVGALAAGRTPLLARSDPMVCHRLSFPSWVNGQWAVTSVP